MLLEPNTRRFGVETETAIPGEISVVEIRCGSTKAEVGGPPVPERLVSGEAECGGGMVKDFKLARSFFSWSSSNFDISSHF